jgi:hypothetical protein
MDPSSEVFHVRRDRNPKGCIFIAKIFLRKFRKVELHGLGEATRLVAIVAEELRRQVATLALIIRTT